jgi:hypothetical protein
MFCSRCGAPAGPASLSLHKDATPALTPNKKRPAWVWVISIYYALWFAFFFSIFCMAAFYSLRLRAYYNDPQVIHRWMLYATLLVYLLLVLAAVLALFLMRRQALQLFCAAVAWPLIQLVYLGETKGWASASSAVEHYGIYQYGILVAVCLYVWKLAKTGVLK